MWLIIYYCIRRYKKCHSEKNQVYSFGKGAYHRLGLNTLQNIFEPTKISELENKKITKISAGCRHALCLDADGNVYGWGFNLYKQLGTQT
jgi:alpha-tubulin suppressor-like RCC1 family protein